MPACVAAGAWRGIHTVGVRDSLEAINGIGHAAVMTNPEFRGALAAHGFTLDPETGEVAELAPYAGAFSARAKQIETNIDPYEAVWRSEHPGRGARPEVAAGVGSPGVGGRPPRQGRPGLGRGTAQAVGRGAARARVHVARRRSRSQVATAPGVAGPGRTGRDGARQARRPTLGVERRRRTR